MKTKINIKYTHYTKGILQGFVGYDVSLQNKNLTVMQVSSALFDLTQHRCSLGVQHRHVPVRIRAKTYPSNAVMIGILKPLCDQGFYIAAEVNASQGYQAWFAYVKHLVVHLESERWSPFACQEIWYTPIVNVDPPLLNTQSPPVLFLDLKEISQGVVDDFLKHSSQPWCILTETTVKFFEEVH